MMRRLLHISAFLIFSFSASFAQKNPKYIFFMIGDGMGLNQVNAAEVYQASLQNRNAAFPLTFTQFPYSTFATSYSLSHGVTDSGAGGTALAVGYKTKNGVIGMDSSASVPYKSIAYYAKESGMKVGITTSVSIDHATPASFYAHQPSRSRYYEIGLDLIESGFDFFGGSGFLNPQTNYKKEDAPSLFPKFEQAGYTLAYGLKEYEQKKNNPKIILMNDKGAGTSSLTYAIDQKPGEMTLAGITSAAIESLSRNNSKGFFLMVEGGKIDWACHANDGAASIHEVRDFDAAIKTAFDFYKKHPEETLIIVTADHETGGLALGNGGSSIRIQNLKHQKISQGKLTELINKLRSDKPKASWEDVKQLLSQQTGLWKEVKVNENDEKELHEAYRKSFINHENEVAKSLYANDSKLAATAIKILNKASSLGWASGSHSAAYIPIYAIGAGAELFTHKMDNTDIPRKVAQAAGWKMD